MSMPKVSKWFGPEVRPVRDGVYLVEMKNSNPGASASRSARVFRDGAWYCGARLHHASRAVNLKEAQRAEFIANRFPTLAVSGRLIRWRGRAEQA